MQEQEPEEHLRRKQQVEAEQAAYYARQQTIKKLMVGNKHQVVDRVSQQMVESNSGVGGPH